MKEHEIATPRDLDVASSANALRRHSQLWKLAEGRSISWAEMLGLGGTILIVGIGLARMTDDWNGTQQIAIGLAMVATVMLTHMQRQVNALVELVKRLEQDTLERRAGVGRH